MLEQIFNHDSMARVLGALACTMHEGADFHGHARKFGDVGA